MKILAKGNPNIIITNSEEFIKETNKNKITKEFLEKCKKAMSTVTTIDHDISHMFDNVVKCKDLPKIK